MYGLGLTCKRDCKRDFPRVKLASPIRSMAQLFRAQLLMRVFGL